jgi:hypothetical protein
VSQLANTIPRWLIPRSQGNTGWDQGYAHPELVSLLSSPESSSLGIPTSGRAVVPGCGMVCLHETDGLIEGIRCFAIGATWIESRWT